MILLKMFWEFFKTGLFTVGGGLATLPFLYRIAEKTGWFTAEDVGTMIAVSESTPGAIGVNMATYVGYMTKGILGAIVATIGLVVPSIIIIVLVSKINRKSLYFNRFLFITSNIHNLGSTTIAKLFCNFTETCFNFFFE